MKKPALTPSEYEILNALPDAVMWVRPVRNEQNVIIDFEVEYCNIMADEVIQHPDGSILGKRVRRDGIPADPVISENNFKNLLRIYRYEVVGDHSFYIPYSNKTYEMNRRKFKDGILSITRDRTAQRQAEQKEREHSDLLAEIIHNAPAGIVVYEARRDATDKITDFNCKLFNQEVNRLTGVSDEDRRNLSLKEILDQNRVAHFDDYINTTETGSPFSFLFFHETTKKWLHFYGVKFGDGFIAIVNDNTQKIEYENELKRQTQYLDSILNSSQNAINTMRAIRNEKGEVVDFSYVQINTAFEKITRLQRSDVLTKTMRQIFPTTFENGVFATYCETLRTAVPSRQQLKYKGEHLDAWFDLSIVKLDDDTLVGTFSDISEIKTAEFQLENSRDRLSRFINTAQSGLGLLLPVFDDQNNLVDFVFGISNNSFADYAGQTPANLEGKLVSEIFPGYMTNKNFDRYKRTYVTGTSTRFESHSVKNGVDSWFDTTATKMAEGILLTVNDISEVKMLQLQLEQYVDELKRSNANLEAFAYAASHDMKEPIRKITFFTDFVMNDPGSTLSDESKKMFSRLLSASIRMNSLIEDLLAYSKINFLPRDFEDVDLNEIVTVALNDLDVQIDEKNATIIKDHLPTIKGESRQLQQLFLNLISNALKYTRQDVSPVIELKSSLRPASQILSPFTINQTINYHLIQVVDNGIGFKQDDAERIFHVFQRLHGNGEYAGTGIGLAIVRKVIENHKGYIWAEGTLNQGSVFYLLFPKE